MSAIEGLIGEFGRLPGIGRKTAQRLTYHLLKGRPEDASRLSAAIDRVVAEVRPTDTSGGLDEIRQRIHERTLDVCGLPPRDVMLVQPSTLPKTSSGKLQRSKCRDEYLAEELSLA